MYGVDLVASSAPVVLAGGGKPGDGLVAYDGAFVDGSGSSITFMTSAGDHSEACTAHVAECRYAIHQIGRDGRGDELVLADAILARPAAGGLVYRRTGAVFAQQSLWFARAGEPDRSLAPEVSSAHHHAVDPRGESVALVTGDRTHLEVRSLRDGSVIARIPIGERYAVLGWNARALPAGTRRLAPAATP
jgi:hypothetical protein